MGVHKKKTNQNIFAALTYLFGAVTGIIFLLFERKNAFVRFHAMQSVITFGGIYLLHVILGYMSGVGLLANGLLSLFSLILWVVLMYKAYKGEYYHLPYIGDLAKQWLKKIG